MNKEKKIITGIVVFALVSFFAYAFVIPLLKQENTEVDANNANSKLVTCNIIVKNPVGLPLIKDGDLIIENIICESIYVRSCIGVFGFVSDKGTVMLKGDGGQGSSVSIDIDEGASDSIQLKWCGSKSAQKVTAIVSDKDNNQLYSKNFALS